MAAQVAWLEGGTLARGVAVGGGSDTGTGLGFLSFSGGSEGPAPVLQDYLDALDALRTHNVQAVAVESTDSAVHVAVEAHCAAMSDSITKRERRFYGGPALAANKDLQLDNGLSLCRELGSELALIVVTPLMRRNIRTGRLEPGKV